MVVGESTSASGDYTCRGRVGTQHPPGSSKLLAGFEVTDTGLC